MDEKLLRRRFLTAVVLLVVAAALLLGGVATYAWFTSSQRVNTSRIATRTNSESVELLVSSSFETDDKGNVTIDYSGGSEGAIIQWNHIDGEALIPVSTADLSFFFSPSSYNAEGYPTAYSPVDGMQACYVGRLYLRAQSSGDAGDRFMTIYLDETEAAGGPLVRKSDEDSLILNAARLGIYLTEPIRAEDQEAYDAYFRSRQPTLQIGMSQIFYLSDETNREEDRMRNTYLNGALQEENIVLAYRDAEAQDEIIAVADPAVPVSAYAITDGGTTPENFIAVIDLNRDYLVNVYFYLEGCDPDCTDSISFDASDLHLAFYGVLS